MGDYKRSARFSAGDAIAFSDEVKEFLYRSGIRSFGIGGGGKYSGVIVGATDQDFAPWLRMGWLKLLALCKPLNGFGSQRPQNEPCGITQERVSQAVNPF